MILSPSFTSRENHKAALLVEKFYIDIRNHATLGNMCSLSATDVKHKLVDRCRAKVCSLTSMTFVLWFTLMNIDISNSCLKFTGPYFSYIFYTGMLRLGNFYLILYFFWFALY
jgi:hypothetical protein